MLIGTETTQNLKKKHPHLKKKVQQNDEKNFWVGRVSEGWSSEGKTIF
jgi:hypothetical protein